MAKTHNQASTSTDQGGDLKSRQHQLDQYEMPSSERIDALLKQNQFEEYSDLDLRSGSLIEKIRTHQRPLMPVHEDRRVHDTPASIRRSKEISVEKSGIHKRRIKKIT